MLVPLVKVSFLKGYKQITFEGHLLSTGKMLKYHLHNEVRRFVQVVVVKVVVYKDRDAFILKDFIQDELQVFVPVGILFLRICFLAGVTMRLDEDHPRTIDAM